MAPPNKARTLPLWERTSLIACAFIAAQFVQIGFACSLPASVLCPPLSSIQQILFQAWLFPFELSRFFPFLHAWNAYGGHLLYLVIGSVLLMERQATPFRRMFLFYLALLTLNIGGFVTDEPSLKHHFYRSSS